MTLDGWFAGTAYEASCGGAIAGKVGAGGTCYVDVDCASARCDGDTACPGTCQPGLYCDGSVTPNTCKALETSGTCASSEECAPGLACPAGSCVPVPGPSQACPQVLDACGPGLYCGGSSTCVDEVGVGQTCTQVGGLYAGCIGGTCDPGGVCVETTSPAISARPTSPARRAGSAGWERASRRPAPSRDGRGRRKGPPRRGALHRSEFGTMARCDRRAPTQRSQPQRRPLRDGAPPRSSRRSSRRSSS